MSIISNKTATKEEIFDIFFPFKNIPKENLVEILISGSEYNIYNFEPNNANLEKKFLFKIQYGWKYSNNRYTEKTIPDWYNTSSDLRTLVKDVVSYFLLEDFLIIFDSNEENAVLINVNHLKNNSPSFFDIHLFWNTPNSVYFRCVAEGLCFHIPIFPNHEDFLKDLPDFLIDIYFEFCEELDANIKNLSTKLSSATKNFGNEMRLLYETRGGHNE